MKHLISIFLVLSLLVMAGLSLISCQTPTEEPDDPAQPGETPEGVDVPGWEEAYLSIDQTGHPEVSASTVDVEALLTVDPDYRLADDYKIRFESSMPQIDYSGVAHVSLHDGYTEEKGLSLAVVGQETPRYMNYRDRDCWLMEFWEDTNVFTITPDAATVAAWTGKAFSINIICHVTQIQTLKVSYTDAQGQEQEFSVTNSVLQEFLSVPINFDEMAMYEGVTFTFDCRGADITRITAVYLAAPVAQKTAETGLIHSKYEQSYYTVADANVLDFGAMGNGYKDDTKAFKDAIAYVKELGGGTVFVPAGYYCLTETLELPMGVGLVGELEQGTAKGTVLCIYGGKGSTDPLQSAVRLNHQSAVMNLAFWYPEQTFVNGTPIPYPATLTQIGSESVTVRNVTFVNAYFGINFGEGSNNSLQYVRDIYGTCLTVGYCNDNSYDIGRFENVCFTPDAWLTSGFPGTPNAELLRTYMLRNSTGMWLQRIDWTYFSDVTIEGYHIGMLYNASATGTANGHSYHMNLLDCYYGIYADQLNWLMLTDSTIRATGGEEAAAIYIGENCPGSMSLSYCTLSSDGLHAVVNQSGLVMSMTACALSSQSDSAFVNLKGGETLLDTTLSGNAEGHSLLSSSNAPALVTTVDYDKTVVTKPASDTYLHMGKEYGIKSGDDITGDLNNAIALLGEGGGIIYLPAGTYTISEPIVVTAGIEVRGAAIWPNCGIADTGTIIHTEVGRNDPDGEALFTLYEGAGLRGLSVRYIAQSVSSLEPYSYTVRGHGAGVYVVDCAMPTSWRGIDFSTYRCDDHYVEYLWGAFLEIGISVGSGSENGIIRDCQFTPNCWTMREGDNWWYQVYEPIMEQGRPWIIGESKGQILYHNFTYGAREGLSVRDGAKEVFVLGHGVDSGYSSAHFSGDCSVYMVNSQLVNLYQQKSGPYLNYLVTDESFTGTLDLINSAYWGNSTKAMMLKGDGHVRLYGALMHNAGAPMCEMSGGTLEIYGMINGTPAYDFVLHQGAQALTLTGNIFNAGIQISQDEGADATLSGTDIAK